MTRAEHIVLHRDIEALRAEVRGLTAELRADRKAHTTELVTHHGSIKEMFDEVMNRLRALPCKAGCVK